MEELTHVGDTGKITMVNIASKEVTQRSATAQCLVIVPSTVLNLLENGEIKAPKGAVFRTAILAGIMGAKKTGELIPLCHPIALDICNIEITINANNAIEITCTANVTAKTGVEMEALTGASIAALTIYDMCKAVSHDILISNIQLIQKTGGKNDFTRTK
jgi:cyclic pyranopterin phosphate synthase